MDQEAARDTQRAFADGSNPGLGLTQHLTRKSVAYTDQACGIKDKTETTLHNVCESGPNGGCMALTASDR